MAIPLKDSALAAWSTNFDTRITATPTVFGLVAAQATAYGVLHDAFIAAYNAASVIGARSKSLVTAKATAKAALMPYARELYGFVQASLTVTDADKDLLGVTVKNTDPAPIPAPIVSPDIDFISVLGRVAKIRIHDAASSNRRKPAGVKGATVFSYVGTTPPEDIRAWKFEGSTTKDVIDVSFPDSVAPGALVWLTAFWFNNRSLSGPACNPVSTHLQFGGVSMAA